MRITESKLREIIRSIIVESGVEENLMPNKAKLEDYLRDNLESLVKIAKDSSSKPGKIGFSARKKILDKVKGDFRVEFKEEIKLTSYEVAHIMGRVKAALK